MAAYDCPECGQGYSSLGELTTHTEQAHAHDIDPVAQIDAESAPEALAEAADPDAAKKTVPEWLMAMIVIDVIIVAIVLLVIFVL